MKDLTVLCMDLDQYHKQLFLTYKKKLTLPTPKFGFLVDDYHSPVGEDECYPSLEYSLVTQ